MTILDALRHQWRRRWRSATRGRSFLATGLLVLIGGYFGLLFVGLGWLYPTVMGEIAPQTDPLRLLNAYLLHGFIGLTVGRFFLQRSAGSALRPYLSLPIQQGKLVRILQAISAMSLFNLLPVVLLAALWRSTVWPSVSPTGAACWAVGVLLAVAFTEFANGCLRAVWDRNAALVLGGAGGLAGLVAVAQTAGIGVLPSASSWLFEGLGAGEVLPLVVLGAGTAGLAAAAHRALRKRRYAVLERASGWSPSSALPTRLLDGQWSTNPVLSLALLDARLILRNKRPRQMLGAGLPLVGMFGVLFVVQDPPPVNVALFSFLLSGYLGMTYAQFGVAWHGRHFDGLLTRAVSSKRIVQAQVAVFVGLCVAPLVPLLPLIAVFAPTLLVSIGAFFLYNLGVTAPLLLGLGLWARKALTLNESTFFNYQGTSTYHFFAVLPVMGFPIGLVAGLGLDTTLLVVAGVGGLGLVTAPLWMRGLGVLLRRQRHAMAAGFRETTEHPPHA
jgi:hypothetical protein